MRSAVVTFAEDVTEDQIRQALAMSEIPVLDVESSDPTLTPEEVASSPFRVVQDGDAFGVVEVDFTGRVVWRASMLWPDAYAARQHWKAATAGRLRRRQQESEDSDLAEVHPLRP